ncbi:hypothetical protein KAU45_01885 [bacterium]|nr:hypothetical protein [bacterium]
MVVKSPPAANLAPVAERVLEADAALGTAVEDFSENNFGLAASNVVKARQALQEVARVQLPLAVVAQHVYTADVNLRFAEAPERALVELEAARNFLKETLLTAGEGERAILGAFLERLIEIIADIEVSPEEKLDQLEALQRDLAEAVLGAARTGGE